MGDKALRLILQYAFVVFGIVLLITIPAGVVVWNAEFAPSIVESFVDNRQDYLNAEALEELFPNNPDALIWLATTEGESLFSEQKLTSIRRAADAMTNLPEVRRVVALPNLPRESAVVTGMRGTTQKIVLNAKLKQGAVPEVSPRLDPILPARLNDPRRNDRELRRLFQTLLADEDSYARKVISRDGQSQVMIVELVMDEPLQPSAQIEIVNKLTQIARENQLGEQALYCSGLIPLQAFAFMEIDSVLLRILPLGGLLISAAVYFVFRRLEVIILTLLIAAASVAWGVAFGIVCFGKFSVLMAAVPLMVLVISTADVIHLVSSYTAETGAGVVHREAVRKTFVHVGGACILTSITTFIGFASLVFVPARTIRQFGVSAAAGVAGALILSVLFVPIFLDLLHRWRRPIVTAGSASAFSDWVSRRCLAIGTGYPRITLVCFVACFALCVALSSRLRLDPDLTQRFSSDHMITESTRFFSEQYGGINSAEIVLRGAPEDLLSQSTMETLRKFASKCRAEHGCEQVDSISNVLQAFLTQLDYSNTTGIPASDEHAVASIRFLRQLEPAVVDSLVTEDERHLRILIPIPATSYLAMTRFSEDMANEARQLFGPSIEVLEKGSAPLVGRAVREIIRGHMQGFVFCFTTIFFLIAFGLRSFRLAWVSALPNLTPLVLLGGLVAYFHEVADSDLLAVGTLGLGLAVDDTIHFLSRFKIELRSGKSVTEALRGSMNHTGLAIIRTTIILSLGFFPFAFAEYWSINMLGTYLIAVLFAALLADLLLLPAIITLVYRSNEKNKAVASE
ncbi:MAG: efflux RND transporter permease subunit [Aureliella sp.]